MDKNAPTYHLGPNQRLILKLLAEHRNGLTEKELASLVYGKPVNTTDFEYIATSRSLRKLLTKGLVVREVKWRLPKKGKQ